MEEFCFFLSGEVLLIFPDRSVYQTMSSNSRTKTASLIAGFPVGFAKGTAIKTENLPLNALRAMEGLPKDLLVYILKFLTAEECVCFTTFSKQISNCLVGQRHAAMWKVRQRLRRVGTWGFILKHHNHANVYTWSRPISLGSVSSYMVYDTLAIAFNAESRFWSTKVNVTVMLRINPVSNVFEIVCDWRHMGATYTGAYRPIYPPYIFNKVRNLLRGYSTRICLLTYMLDKKYDCHASCEVPPHIKMRNLVCNCNWNPARQHFLSGGLVDGVCPPTRIIRLTLRTETILKRTGRPLEFYERMED